jgi:hypothetical protein
LYPAKPADERVSVRDAARAFLERGAGSSDSQSAGSEELARRYKELQQWKAEAEEHLRRMLDLLGDEAAESDR